MGLEPCIIQCNTLVVVFPLAKTAMPIRFLVNQLKGLGFSGFISEPIDEELFPYQLARIIDGEKIWHDGSFATL